MDPARDAPERVQRAMQPGKLCVMFFGPAANKVRRVPQQRSSVGRMAHTETDSAKWMFQIQHCTGQRELWLCLLYC